MQQTSVQKQKKLKIRGGFYMFKKMKHMKNEKGLTLIELLAVIVILAIIAAIAIPAIGNIINNQRDKAVLAEVSNAISTAKIAYVDGTCGTDKKCDSTDLDFKGKKITVTSVDFSTADKEENPEIIWEFKDAGGKFNGTKFKVDKTVLESTLNSVMENGAPAPAPAPAP